MGVFIRNGAYWTEFYANGQRKRKRIGSPLSTEMKKVALNAYAKRRAEVAEGRFIERKHEPTGTFDDLAEAYLAWIRPDDAKGIPARKRSWRSDDVYAIGKLRPYFSGQRLRDITPAMVSQYQAHRLASLSRFGRPVKPSTVNRELAILRTMFNVAQRGVLILKGGVPEHNPVASRVAFTKEYNERDVVLSPEELDRLLAVAPKWLQPIMIVAYDSGMRRGEIAQLRWSMIDMKARVIKLASTDTKTDEKRLVPLTDRLIQMLHTTPRHVSGYVFVTRNGRPYHPTKISAAFKKACGKAGLRDVAFHDCRHSFCTNMRRAGVDTLTTMAISGHKSIEVFKRYNTISPQNLQKAIRQLGTYMDTDTSHGSASTE
jgi:integrase